MARPKEFDESRALVDAMGLFWERGYEATTMRDVAARAGLALSSLYATFESKHALYLAALAEYRRTEREQVVRLLAAPRPVREALADLYKRLIANLTADPARRGSFTLNAAIELGGQDEAVPGQLREHFDDICALLAPPLATHMPSAGYIQAYPPGVRENGGQYSHGGIWALMAQARSAQWPDADEDASDLPYRSFTWLSPAHRSAHPTQGPAHELDP